MVYPQRSSPAINTSSTCSARGAHTRHCTAPSDRPRAPQRGISPYSMLCPSCERLPGSDVCPTIVSNFYATVILASHLEHLAAQFLLMDWGITFAVQV